MAIISVDDTTLDVDIRAELDEYDWGVNARWTNDKLIAASPFRYDRSPSFFIRLEEWGEYPAGIWSDSGATDGYYERGDFVKLLAFLRAETREEALTYLIDKYAPRQDGKLTLISKSIRLKERRVKLPSSIVKVAPSPYLLSRAISLDVIESAGIGRGKHYGYCAMPWRNATGDIMNVLYRATKGKAFFFENGATPIRKLLYGMENVTDADAPLVICEAPIDALSWRTAGIQAVATGSASVSDEQLDLLRRLPASKYVLAGDNDGAGRRFNQRLARGLAGEKMALVQYGTTLKDANAILKKTQSPKALRQIVEDALDIPQIRASINL